MNTDALLLFTLCTWLSAFIPLIVKHVLKLFYGGNAHEKMLKRQLHALHLEQSKISMVDEFPKYARLQRKINAIGDQLKSYISSRNTNYQTVKVTITYVAHFLLGVFMIVLLWNYGHLPVIVLPEHYLYPFGWLISWPLQTPGGISPYIWIFITRTAAAHAARLFT